MTDTTSHDVIVIGAGVAGLAAARETLRAGLSTAFLEAQMFGGLVLNVNQLDGAVTGNGAEFASNLMAEVMDLGGENLEGVAGAIEHDGDALVVASDTGRHRARAVIVASGAALRRLGVPGEAELEHKGVSHCADCDGPMFHGQTVTVVGGGDSALQSAAVLAGYCERVHLIHRGTAFRAKAHWQAAVSAAPNIAVSFGSEVNAVIGTDGVEGVRVGAEVIPCSGFFAFVGLEPNSAFLPATVARDAHGAVLTNDRLETAMPGVYAAGAVRAGAGGMIEDALSDGARAARAVAQSLRS